MLCPTCKGGECECHRNKCGGTKHGEEAGLIRDVLEYLAIRKIWAYRQNTGTLRGASGKLVRFGSKGCPDIIARLKPTGSNRGSGRVLWIECKSKTGKLSEAQEAWRAKAEKHGDVFIVARRLEDVMEFLG